MDWKKRGVLVLLSGLLTLLSASPVASEEGAIPLFDWFRTKGPCHRDLATASTVGYVTIDQEMLSNDQLVIDVVVEDGEPEEYLVWFWYGDSSKCRTGAFTMGYFTVESDRTGLTHIEFEAPGLWEMISEGHWGHFGVQLELKGAIESGQLSPVYYTTPPIYID